jgi:3-dehydroquinate dehydratase-2
MVPPLLALSWALVSLGPLAYRPRHCIVRGSVAMKILVVQGAGMNMRGKTQTEIFGTMTLDQYNQHITQYATELDIEVEIFHSNIEGEVSNRLYAANDQGFDGALVNPAGFSRGYPALTAAISQVTFPVIEVHISNPVRRGPVSDTATVSLGMVTGFGVLGYYLALRGLRDRGR